MEERLIGEKIAYYRMKAGMSQEKVAECLEVSRQAVTKWEGDVSKPSSDNLIKLAKLFDVDVEVLLGNKEDNTSTTADDVTISNAPWIFIVISLVVLVSYVLFGAVLKSLSPGTVITGFIVFIPIQLFLHIYFINAIKNESFNGLAGYNSKISYDTNSLKRLLTQIDMHIGVSSTVFIFLNCVSDLLHLGTVEHVAIFIVYIVDFILAILINNYSMIDKLYNHDEDKERARKGMPVTVVYLILLFAGLLVTIILFETRGIENNSVPAIRISSLLIVGVLFATAGYVVESKNISRWQPGENKYKISKFGILGVLLCVTVFVLMFVI